MNTTKQGENTMTIKQYLQHLNEDYNDYLKMCDKPYWTWTPAEKLLDNMLVEAYEEQMITEKPAYIVEEA